MKPGPWKSLAQVRTAHRAADLHWFSKEAVGFFESKTHGDMVAGRYFISSEQPPGSSERRYKIRYVKDNGVIFTLAGTPSTGFVSLHDARSALSQQVAEHGAECGCAHGGKP